MAHLAPPQDSPALIAPWQGAGMEGDVVTLLSTVS